MSQATTVPFAQAWREHGRRVARLVDLLVSRSPAAQSLRDDVLAGATEGLWEACVRFDPGRGVELWAYAYPVVRGRAVDVLRQYDVLPRSARTAKKSGGLLAAWSLEERTGIDEVAHTLASTSDPEGEAARSEEVRLVLEAAARLPERQSLVFDRAVLRGEPYRDLASALGLTECRVSQLVSEAAASLRARLGRDASPAVTVASGGKSVLAIEHEGRTATLAEWARAKGLSKATVRARLRRGLRAEEIFSPRHRTGYEAPSLTFRGESKTVREWASDLGWSYRTLLSRVTAGWPVERVLTEPPKRGRRPNLASSADP